MRAISLWQPWATAMALGLKRIETRAWRPGATVKVPFELAIHAAKRWTKAEQSFYSDMREVCPTLPDDVPLGKIVAVCTVTGLLRTEQVTGLSDLEFNWGNYADGRWAWVTENVRPLREPIPWKGKQGFFDVPDALILAAL